MWENFFERTSLNISVVLRTNSEGLESHLTTSELYVVYSGDYYPQDKTLLPVPSACAGAGWGGCQSRWPCCQKSQVKPREGQLHPSFSGGEALPALIVDHLLHRSLIPNNLYSISSSLNAENNACLKMKLLDDRT